MSIKKKEYTNSAQVEFLIQNAACSKHDAEKVVSLFWRANLYNTLLEDGYYLRLVSNYLINTPSTPQTRHAYYTYFERTLLADTSIKTMDVAKLAFIMDLMQTVEIDSDEVELLLSKQDIRKLIDKKIFLQAGDNLKFYHTSIHSYFSAVYLTDARNPINFLETLLKASGTIPPAWYEVIAFALQSSNREELAQWLLRQLSLNQNLIEEGLLDAIEQARIENLVDIQAKHSIFNTIWRTYQKRAIWLPDSAEKILARFSSAADRDMLYLALDRYDETNLEGIVTRGNIVAIIDEALNFKMMDSVEQEKWHVRLIEFAIDKNDNGVLQRRAIHGLEFFKNKHDITKISSSFSHKDKFVREAFVRFCHVIAPNDRITIQYIAKLSLRGSSIYARYGYYDITTKLGIHNFFSVVNSNSKYLSNFLKDDSIFNANGRNEDERLIKLIYKFSSERMIKDVAKFLAVTFQDAQGYHFGRTFFVRQLLRFLVENDQDLSSLANIIGPDQKTYKLFDIGELFASVANRHNYIRILEVLTKSIGDTHKEGLANTFYSHLDSEVKVAAIDGGHYHPVHYEQQEEVDDHEKEPYREFIHRLEPKPGQYMLDVFSYYMSNLAAINKFMSADDFKRLEHLVKNLVLDNFDPLDTILTINGRNEDKSITNFTISNLTQVYGDVLKVGVQLYGNEHIASNYRKQLINFIPYADYDDRELVSELLGALELAEIKQLISFYRKNTDTRYYMIDSLSDVLLNQAKINVDISLAKDTLKSLVRDDLLRIHERKLALETLGVISSPDLIGFLRTTFRLYCDKDANALAEEANKILIQTYHDKAATKWRFKEVASRSAPFIHPEGVHTVGELEDELHDKKFGGVLTTIDEEYFNDFLRLMETSFQILQVDNTKYMNYSVYIWSLTVSYLEHLVHRPDSHTYLAKLDKWYARKSKIAEGANWFEGKLEGLRKLYASEATKQSDIANAIALAESL